MSARTTIGNSRPFALCTVISRTPSLPSSRIGASGDSARFEVSCSSVDEAAERQPAFHFVAARQVRDVQHVGEHLLAAAPQDEAGMRARHRDQAADRVGDRPMIARGMQVA